MAELLQTVQLAQLSSRQDHPVVNILQHYKKYIKYLFQEEGKGRSRDNDRIVSRVSQGVENDGLS